MSVIHFSFASDGGASRAGRRASLACREAGLNSSFAFVSGKRIDADDIHIFPAPGNGPESDLARTFNNDIQWDLIPNNRSEMSNSLLSMPYPGVEIANHRAFETCEILHLHWPTWALPPRALARALQKNKTVFWTLHDMWPVTGGCHYSAGCDQFETVCLKCPQLPSDVGLINNSFEEKLNCYARGGSLHVVAPSHWIGDVARRSAILSSRPIHVVPNPIELDVFKPRKERAGLRQAYGIADRDFVLMMGSADLRESRKGVKLLVEALTLSVADGSLPKLLQDGAAIYILFIGKEFDIVIPPSVKVLKFGEIVQDTILVDIYALADVLAIPSLEDNHPNMIVEGMACGVPVIGFDVGGVGEMIEDEKTGLLVRPAGSVAALKDALTTFAAKFFNSTQMRQACRVHAQTNASSAKVGRELAALYEKALGRPLSQAHRGLYSRMLLSLAKAPSKVDVTVGQNMLGFPTNMFVAQKVEKIATKRFPMVAPYNVPDDRRCQLIAVRTFHEHHSARSGPYQFVRFLPGSEYSTRNFAVPLDSTLVSKSKELLRRAGVLAGAKAMAQQGNAWLAEAEIFVECAMRPTDVVHFVDGELAGTFLPNMPDFTFWGGWRPTFVATFHQPENILKTLINPFNLSSLDGIVVLCETQRIHFASLTDPRKIRVIPHGVDTGFFIPPTTRRLETKGKIRLLLVGHWLRDLQVAMDAFQILGASEFDFELRIISPRLNATVLGGKIVLLKDLSDEALRDEYRAADILYLPLVDATANNAVLEAMACGLPVVSTSVGGVPEAVGLEAGLLCKSGAAEEFAQAVLQLARSPDMRIKCGEAGRKRAERFSWRRIAALHDEFYQTLREKRRQNPARPQDCNIVAAKSDTTTSLGKS